jgi:hypothetical protein
MPPRAKNEWRREPYPGELLYHLKWSHGVWVSEKNDAPRLDAIHRQLHGPPPEGWRDNGTWAADHQHEWPPEQPELPLAEEDNWEW